jgi:hypothetical protein
VRNEEECVCSVSDCCFKFRCNILISGKIIKEVPGSVASGTHCTILPVVLFGCETWSLTLRKERRLRVFGNRV